MWESVDEGHVASAHDFCGYGESGGCVTEHGRVGDSDAIVVADPSLVKAEVGRTGVPGSLTGGE